MKAALRWWCCHVFFVSWGKWWKGVYIHFLPRYTVRLFLWGLDARPKAWLMPQGHRETRRLES